MQRHIDDRIVRYMSQVIGLPNRDRAPARLRGCVPVMADKSYSTPLAALRTALQRHKPFPPQHTLLPIRKLNYHDYVQLIHPTLSLSDSGDIGPLCTHPGLLSFIFASGEVISRCPTCESFDVQRKRILAGKKPASFLEYSFCKNVRAPIWKTPPQIVPDYLPPLHYESLMQFVGVPAGGWPTAYPARRNFQSPDADCGVRLFPATGRQIGGEFKPQLLHKPLSKGWCKELWWLNSTARWRDENDAWFAELSQHLARCCTMRGTAQGRTLEHPPDAYSWSWCQGCGWIAHGWKPRNDVLTPPAGPEH